MYLITNLLLSNGGFVAAHGSHGFELSLFLDGPLGQLPQRQEQSVPVIRIVFKSISVKQKQKNNRLLHGFHKIYNNVQLKTLSDNLKAWPPNKPFEIIILIIKVYFLTIHFMSNHLAISVN
jgi:hypothetical protein